MYFISKTQTTNLETSILPVDSISGISVSVSSFTMLAISVERFYAICRPLKSIGWQTKSHAYKVYLESMCGS